MGGSEEGRREGTELPGAEENKALPQHVVALPGIGKAESVDLEADLAREPPQRSEPVPLRARLNRSNTGF